MKKLLYSVILLGCLCANNATVGMGHVKEYARSSVSALQESVSKKLVLLPRSVKVVGGWLSTGLGVISTGGCCINGLAAIGYHSEVNEHYKRLIESGTKPIVEGLDTKSIVEGYGKAIKDRQVSGVYCVLMGLAAAGTSYAGYKIYQHVFTQDAKLEQEKALAEEKAKSEQKK